jgi:hypothetical protein
MIFLKNKYVIALLVLIVVAATLLCGYLLFPRFFIKANPNNLFSKTPLVPNTPNNSVVVPKKEPKVVKPFKVKGVYFTGWSAGTESKVNHFINLIKNTELNTLVIDVKDDSGRVSYKSSVPLAIEVGSSTNMVADIKKTIEKFKKNNVHLIARIVVFKDPVLAQKRPDLAIKTIKGTVWHDRTNAAWLDPNNSESWKYSIDLAKEAVSLGFDEVQFDYVRFPTDGNIKVIDYKSKDGKIDKTKPINAFLAYAKKEINAMGAAVSADVFGIITTNIGDVEKIGQDLDTLSKQVDYVSPMVYPSHYAFGQYNIRRPDLEPYKTVSTSLKSAKTRIDKLPAPKAVIRPYLQDFTASWIGRGNYKRYGAADVRAQIKAAYDSGIDEWILWNANNRYSESAFLKK